MITFPDARLRDSFKLDKLLANAGLAVITINNVETVTGPGTSAENESNAQAIINNFDAVGYIRQRRRLEIKDKRAARYIALYPSDLEDQDPASLALSADIMGNSIDLALDLWASIHTDARTPSTAWAALLAVRAAAKVALHAVNQASTIAEIDAVQVVWP